ncbi:hypothetical protein AB6T38_14875 [Aliiglaciecola sp. SL4]|uniref:hypothetical protein n=1 Tax=Aliiglaciecola sp. SL4 TaxID=3239806 RepID=UPI00355C0CDD
MKTQINLAAITSLICALSFIFGLSLILLWVPDFNEGPTQRLLVFTEHRILMQFWYFVVYIVFAIAILLLSMQITAKGKLEHSKTHKITMLVSYLWSSYIFASGLIAILSIELLFNAWLPVNGSISDVWQDIYAIQMGLGEGVEWVGGIWMLTMTLTLIEQQQFPRLIHGVGFITAVCGLLTLFPNFSIMGAIFGMLQVVWFIWLSIVLYLQGRSLRANV